MSKNRARLSRRNRAKNPERTKKGQSSPPALCESPPPTQTGPVPTGTESLPEQSDPGADREDYLTYRQQSAIPIIAAAPTTAQAARDTGLSERTIRRWLEDEEFREELTRLRTEQSNFVRQELKRLMVRGAAVLAEAMEDPNMAIRLRAANYTFSFGSQVDGSEELGNRLQALEDAVSLNDRTKPPK